MEEKPKYIFWSFILRTYTFSLNKQPQIFGWPGAVQYFPSIRIQVVWHVVCFYLDCFGRHVLKNNYFHCNILFHACFNFLNTLTTDDEYSRSNRENLPPLTQRQLSEKLKTFYFYCSFGMYVKLWTFWKKNEPRSPRISEVIDSERRAYWNA